MRIGITLEDEKGFESYVAQHFGQCRYFFIVDIKDSKIVETKVVPNNNSMVSRVTRAGRWVMLESSRRVAPL